jgi:transcriptional regulator with GAF, ATPase, and Fis domain
MSQEQDRTARPAAATTDAAAPPLGGTTSVNLQEVERSHITGVLETCGWKVKGAGNAADRLGLKESTLRSRMKKLGIERPRA